MHIKISRSSISEVLNNVQTVVGAKTALPVLQNVKVAVKDGKAEFVCSDLEVTLQATAECEVLEEGETTIPVKLLSAVVGKVVDGVLDIEVKADDKAKLTAGTSMFRFNGISALEFPKLPQVEGDKISIPSATLREMLRKASIAMSVDETRANLKGILLDFSQGGGVVTAVATDGRRLSLLNCTTEVPAGFNGKFIIPRKAVDALLKRLPKDGDCEITVVGLQLCFISSKMRLTTKVIDAVYPNYMQVVPKEVKHTITINRADFIGAIDRVSVMAESGEGFVEITFGDNRLVLNSQNAEFGSSTDEIPIKYADETISMKFNPLYIREALNVIDEDEVDFLILSATAPTIIRKGGSDDYTYVVMPLRI